METALDAMDERHTLAAQRLRQGIGGVHRHGRRAVIVREVLLDQLGLTEQGIEVAALGPRGVDLGELELVEERVEHREHHLHASLPQHLQRHAGPGEQRAVVPEAAGQADQQRSSPVAQTRLSRRDASSFQMLSRLATRRIA
jgi:hypothetical protein